MTTQERTLKALEWSNILKTLSTHATCEIGKERCLNTPIFDNIDEIKLAQSFTSQAKFLLDNLLHPPLTGIRNITEFIKIANAGQTLKNLELIDIAHTLAASRRLKSYFQRYQEEIPLLFEISRDLYENKHLEEYILDIFDDHGNMLDTASPELRGLRIKFKDQSINLKNKLKSLMNSAKLSKYLQENVYTVRGDRYVIPVKQEFKSFVPGIIHDSSSSGATLFIEPREIVEHNNLLKEIELNIEHEVQRILAEISQQVKGSADEILNSLDILAEIDFTFAKAKYSISLKAVEPSINNEKIISLMKARHPILVTTIPNVVPNDVEIGKDWNTLIITGSNTGGKTVILKTVGLCTLMTKAGLHVPALVANIYPFKNICADIGDEQSVIQNLSTFSGHMTNIINILNKSDNNTLVLLDELGAGTDPSEGSALAQAILESLAKRGSRTIITTHYGELKALAYTKKEFYNASVEFNIDDLTPTYKLLMGLPGKSNAITISLNLGLEKNIGEQAQNIYITQKDPTGDLLEGLQTTQQELSRNAQKVETTKDELEKLEKEYNEKIEKLRKEKKLTLNIYKKKFDGELSRAKAEIKELLEEIRRTKSEKIIRRSYGRLNNIEDNFRAVNAQEEETLDNRFEKINWSAIKIGDSVVIKNLEQDAILLTMPDKNKNVQVQIGNLKTFAKADNLAKAQLNKKKNDPVIRKHSKSYSIIQKTVSNSLDLRGKTVDDGLNETEYYLDKASLANLSPVSIIHGHGTGILRVAIREYLKLSPYVKTFRPGDKTEGGDGVSVVELV